jgi:hypothetical protein
MHRIIFVSNHLPIRAKKDPEGSGYTFEFDEDALIAQAKVRLVCRVLGDYCEITHALSLVL